MAIRSVDVVHAHLGEDIAVLPMAHLAAARHHVPLVVTVHSSPWLTLRPVDRRTATIHEVGGLAERHILPTAARVMVLTERTARLLRRQGISDVEIVPLGIDLEPFARQTRDPTPSAGHPRIVCVARLVTSKGVDVLIRSLGHLRGDRALVIVGDGPQRGALVALAAALGVGHRVRWTGSLSHDDVATHLMHADIAVLPSRFEEAGRCLVEAMAARTPVVATRVGGIPCIVRDGVNGVLVPPGDPIALAGSIERVLADPALGRALVASGEATASAHSPDALAAAVLRCYRRTIAPSGASLKTTDAG